MCWIVKALEPPPIVSTAHASSLLWPCFGAKKLVCLPPTPPTGESLCPSWKKNLKQKRALPNNIIFGLKVSQQIK